MSDQKSAKTVGGKRLIVTPMPIPFQSHRTRAAAEGDRRAVRNPQAAPRRPQRKKATAVNTPGPHTETACSHVTAGGSCWNTKTVTGQDPGSHQQTIEKYI